MQKLLLIGALLSIVHLEWSPSAAAATATHFTCTPDLGSCSCNPDIQGDCDKMKINCKDGIITGCVTIGTWRSCGCKMGKVQAGSADKKKLNKKAPPADTVE